MKLLFLLLLVTMSFAEEFIITSGDSIDTDVLIAQKIVTEAYSNVGIKVSFRYYPWERSLLLTNEGTHDAELIRITIVEEIYPNLIRVPVPLKKICFHAITADSTLHINSWDDLKGKRIAFQRGMKILQKKTKGMRVTEIDDFSKVEVLLKNGRIDAFLGNYPNPDREHIRYSEFIVSENPVLEHLLYHYIHKSHADILQELTTELEKMKEEGRITVIIDSITEVQFR